jgi:hypothetical protein
VCGMAGSAKLTVLERHCGGGIGFGNDGCGRSVRKRELLLS